MVLRLRKWGQYNMADIVQLQENGVAKYMKTHANAIDRSDLLKGKVLWSGSAKQGATLTLNDNVRNYTMLVMVMYFGNGYHSSVFFPTDTTANCVATSIYNSLSATVSICKYLLQKKSDTSYIVSLGRENSGSSTAEGTNVTGTVAKIVGIR